jgi:hypothetical protein
MFLIRTAFWLSLIILLLPTNEDDQRTVYGAAEAAVRDMSSFCTRNPDVCAKSRDAFDVFSQKAEFGARMVMDFMSDATSDQAPVAAVDEKGNRFPTTYRDDPQSTLTDRDREPGWFGPSSKSGV